MALRRICRILLLSALITGFITGPTPAARADLQETAPCAKLTAQETRYRAGTASRVVFVTAADATQPTVLITGCVRVSDGYVQEWQQAGFIGKNGFAPEGQLREGQYRSPTGAFSATEALGIADPGTKLLYHTVNPKSRWGGPGSPSYNSYVEGGSLADENLWYWMNQGTYEQAAVINYNRLPDAAPVPGADYAIFFGAGNRASAGCVSTTLETSTRVVKTLAPGDRFIMGAVSDVFLPSRPIAASPAAPGAVAPSTASPATTAATTATAATAATTATAATAATTASQGIPAADSGTSSLVLWGLALVVGGAAAVVVSVVLSKRVQGRRA